MKRCLALFLAALLLLQTLGPEVLAVNYALNRARITAQFCVNKARPLLRCNGKCHLARQLRRIEGPDKKAPTAPALAKVKYEVLPTAAVVLRAPRRWPAPARRYLPARLARCAAGAGQQVFRPPLA